MVNIGTFYIFRTFVVVYVLSEFIYTVKTCVPVQHMKV